MAPNLPSMLPTGGSHSSSLGHKTSAHAQNFSTSKLNQQKERDAATVSIGQAISKKTHGDNGASSALRHGKQQGARTSVHRPPQTYTSTHDDGYRDEVRNRLRYRHIRKLMKEKQSAEIQSKNSS